MSDSGLQALLHVDGTTGDRNIFSGCSDAACSSLVGGGTAFTDPVGVVVKAVPEPGSMLGLAVGSALLLALRRRQLR